MRGAGAEITMLHVCITGRGSATDASATEKFSSSRFENIRWLWDSLAASSFANVTFLSELAWYL